MTSSRSCANWAWWTSPSRDGSLRTKTASCCSTSRAVRGRWRASRRSVRMPRGSMRRLRPMLRVRRPMRPTPRRSAAPRPCMPSFRASKRAPRSCARGANSIPSRLEELAEKGIVLRYFSAPRNVYDKQVGEWSAQYTLAEIHRSDTTVWFVVVAAPGEELQLDAQELKAPRMDVREVERRMEETRRSLKALDADFFACRRVGEASGGICRLAQGAAAGRACEGYGPSRGRKATSS